LDKCSSWDILSGVDIVLVYEMACAVSNAGDVAYTSLVVVIAVIECNRLKSVG
jgi:hypothetical protein